MAAKKRTPARTAKPGLPKVNPRRRLAVGLRAYELASQETPLAVIAEELGLSEQRVKELIERETREALVAQAADRRGQVFMERDRSIRLTLGRFSEVVERECPECDATGRASARNGRRCVSCKGSGYFYSEFYRAQARDGVLRCNDMLNRMWGTYAPEKLWLRAEVEIPFISEVLAVPDDELEQELADLQAPLGASDDAFAAADRLKEKRALPRTTEPTVVSTG